MLLCLRCECVRDKAHELWTGFALVLQAHCWQGFGTLFKFQTRTMDEKLCTSSRRHCECKNPTHAGYLIPPTSLWDQKRSIRAAKLSIYMIIEVVEVIACGHLAYNLKRNSTSATTSALFCQKVCPISTSSSEPTTRWRATPGKGSLKNAQCDKFTGSHMHITGESEDICSKSQGSVRVSSINGTAGRVCGGYPVESAPESCECGTTTGNAQGLPARADMW